MENNEKEMFEAPYPLPPSVAATDLEEWANRWDIENLAYQELIEIIEGAR